MGGAHILIVDDDGFFRRAVSDSLDGLGYRLSCAEDVPGALSVLRNERVDVVVADHVMPGLSGLALLTSMREHLPETRRILVSGQVDVATALAAINQAAVFRFVTKPFDPVAIRLAVCCAVDDLLQRAPWRAQEPSHRTGCPVAEAFVGRSRAAPPEACSP